MLGETPEVKGLWSAAAVWIKEGPGVGRAVAERMTHGHSEIDISHSDIARFYPHQKHPRPHQGAHVGGVQQDLRDHPPRRAVRVGPRRSGSPPCTRSRSSRARCSSRPPAGSARSGTSPTPRLVEEYGDRVMPREHEWDARWWSPIINAEHLRMRETAGIVDLSAFAIFDVGRPRRPRDRADRVRRPVRRRRSARSSTPRCSTPTGGFVSDLTVMRLGHDHFRVVTGGAHGMVDRKWFADLAARTGAAAVTDLTSAYTTIGIWGPRARDVLASLTSADVSHEAFGFGTCRTIEVDSLSRARLPDLLRRRARLGALRADRAGRPPVVDAARGRGRPRRDPGRHRRLRHHRPDREGLPRVRCRARRRALRSSRRACSGPR